MSRKALRPASGQSTIMLVLLVAFAVLPLIGFFSFEVARANLAQQQLQNAVDSATLTAVAWLASSSNPDAVAAHNDAVQASVTMFKKNLILGSLLTNTTVSTTPTMNPAAGNANLYFQYMNSSGAVVPASDSNGRMVKISAAYGVMPAFAKFLGFGNYIVRVNSSGMVPQLDVVVCFDVSGSMDDQTPVTFTKRRWDPMFMRILYDVPVGAKYGTSGKIYDLTQSLDVDPIGAGTTLNALAPQFLSAAYDNDQVYFYDNYAEIQYPGQPLKKMVSNGVYPSAGKPPGNVPPGTANVWLNTNIFTDMVVNLDGNTTFGGISDGGYSFPNVASLVEASRGNLESTAVFTSSKANTVLGSITPKPGYQAKYQELARKVIQPLKDAKTAAQAFIDNIHADTDAHIGFVAFDSRVGTSSSSTVMHYDLDECVTPASQVINIGVQKSFPLPMVPLTASGSDGYTETQAAINTCTALESTNIGKAIDQAVQELQSHSRTGSTKIIVLFTDGVPSAGGPLSPDPSSNARLAAVKAKDAGIPVYTIGLSQNTDIVAKQQEILNDTDSNPSTGGIAAISGHGATFNLVSNSSQLQTTFQNLAKQLVQVVAAE